MQGLSNNGRPTRELSPCISGDAAQSVQPQLLNLRALIVFALISMLPLLWALLRQEPGGWASLITLAAHVVALALWASWLRVCRLQTIWCCLAVLGLASMFATSPFGLQDSSALAEGVLLCLLASVFSAYERQPNLQSIAAAALLMSAGVLMKPSVAISCLLISVVFFVLHRRRTHGGSLGFALLMFTPSVLCIASATLLALVTGGVLSASALAAGTTIGQEPGFLRQSLAPSFASALPHDLSMRWLIFPLTVIIYRACIKRAAACDVALGLMLLGITILSSFPQMSQTVHQIDIFYVALGGGAALLAELPPRRHVQSLLICGSLLAAAYFPVI